MAVSLSISAVLLLVWFLYACQLILNSGDQRNCLAPLEEPSIEQDYEPVDEAKLHNDYQLADYLLRNANELQPEGQATVERVMIHLYYTIVRLCYFALRWMRPGLANWLKQEMSIVVHYRRELVGDSRHFANP